MWESFTCLYCEIIHSGRSKRKAVQLPVGAWVSACVCMLSCFRVLAAVTISSAYMFYSAFLICYTMLVWNVFFFLSLLQPRWMHWGKNVAWRTNYSFLLQLSNLWFVQHSDLWLEWVCKWFIDREPELWLTTCKIVCQTQSLKINLVQNILACVFVSMQNKFVCVHAGGFCALEPP